MKRIPIPGREGAIRSWRNMINRCSGNNANYSGRGIKVCKRWNDFERFYEDMGPRPKGLTLERKDNNGDYKKSNCKWATYAEQSLNKRPYKSWSKKTKDSFNNRVEQLAKRGKGPRSRKAYEKMAQTNIGRETSQETKVKISVAQKDRPLSKEHVAALNAAYEGKRGERRRKHMSEAMSGRVFSDETRRKMSEAARRRWQQNQQ